ncbi:protein DOG1-like 4 [Coffea eugenioides]|uniref:protein DOG1-like 4 n=1 Tax=Coffea eugenioides TaxID=49369 RepID=UPI000F605D84|nr:protein DOG1-like 4 [Coffea eugenioides]
MRTKIEEKFSNFFETWMSKLEEYVQHHLTLKKENKSSDEEVHYVPLVNKLTQHHKDYYTAKWACASEDVLAFFTPVWLSPLENAYLWITGWKPSMILRLVDSLRKGQVPGATSLADLSEEQVKKIEGLRSRIRVDEEKVEREMERQQVAMADRKMVELARLVSLTKNGEHLAAASSSQINGLVEMATKELLAGLEKVMKMADCVRLKTLKGVLDVLNPMQSADFLASSSVLQIQMRKWGKKREKRSVNECENHK